MALLKLVVLFAMVGLLRAECLQGDEDCVPASDNSTDASTSASRERRDNHLPELQADQYSENEESIAGRQAYLPPPPPPPPPPMYAPPPPIKCYMVCPTENIMLPVPPTTPPPPPPPPPTYAPPTAAPYMYPTPPPPTPAPYMYPTTTAPPPYMYPTTTTPPPYFYPTTTLAPPAYYPAPVTTPRPY